MNLNSWTVKDFKRLTTKFTVGDDCWQWTAALNRDGYSNFWLDGKMVGAHRLVYGLLAGDLPLGVELDHICKNRACVNPSHLDPVSHRENVIRGASPCAENSKKTHCIRGHALSGANLLPGGNRRCRSCKNERARNARAKAKG